MGRTRRQRLWIRGELLRRLRHVPELEPAESMSDLYGDIEEFVRNLRRGGLGQLAQSLEDAVLYGATSGEILTNVAPA